MFTLVKLHFFFMSYGHVLMGEFCQIRELRWMLVWFLLLSTSYLVQCTKMEEQVQVWIWKPCVKFTATFTGIQDIFSFSYCIFVSLSELGSFYSRWTIKGWPASHVTLGRWVQKVKIFSIVHFPRDCRSLGQEDPGGGNGNPLQHSCLENPMDRGIWQATVHGVAKSLTRLSVMHIAVTADRTLNLHGGLQDKTSFSLHQPLTVIFPFICAFYFI